MTVWKWRKNDYDTWKTDKDDKVVDFAVVCIEKVELDFYANMTKFEPLPICFQAVTKDVPANTGQQIVTANTTITRDSIL